MREPDWNCNGISLYRGDSREILREIETGSIDAVITDPPYGISLNPQRKKTKAIKNDARNEAKALFTGLMLDLDRVTKEDTTHLIFGGWSEQWVPQTLREWWLVKSCIVWKKHVFGIGYYTRPQHEFIWYCHKGEPAKPEKAISDVWEFKREMRPIHSCQKPIDLMERCVEFVSDYGDTVLDPFAGSGSTLIAAFRCGRKAIGIEMEQEYFDMAVKRLEEQMAEEAA